MKLVVLQDDGHATEQGPELDEEMEKVFAMDAGEKFDVARLRSPADSPRSNRDRRQLSKYNDDEFNRESLHFFKQIFY